MSPQHLPQPQPQPQPQPAASCSAQPWPHSQQTTPLCALSVSQATLLPDSRSILVFGGLCKGRRFNSTHVFDVDTRAWRDAEVAGTLPLTLTLTLALALTLIRCGRRSSRCSPRAWLGLGLGLGLGVLGLGLGLGLGF